MAFQGIRTGVDLVDIPRFSGIAEARGNAFLSRLFTASELSEGRSLQSLAARFAAKEAFMKALGTGLSGGLSWQDIEIVREEDAPPRIVASRKAAELLGSCETALSLSHTATSAIAIVVISGGEVP